MGIGIQTLTDRTKRADDIVADNPKSLVVNDLMDDDETLTSLSTLVYRVTKDELDPRPSCLCGKLRSLAILEYSDKDEECDVCNSAVSSLHNRDLKPIVFVRSPNGVAPFIDIKTIHQLVEAFTITDRTRSKNNSFSVIQYIMDTRYTVHNLEVANDLTELGIRRGYNYFIEEFTNIMAILCSYKHFAGRKNCASAAFIKLWDTERDKILSRHMYMLNRDLIILEKNNGNASYLRKGVTDASTVVRMFVGIDRLNAPEENLEFKQNTTARALVRLANFYYTHHKDVLSGKSGLLKSHVQSTRSVIGMRCVVTSIARNLEYDTIKLPWGPTIMMMRTFLMSKLVKRGYEMESAIRFLEAHTHKYEPLIHQLFDELMNENPDKCIPLLVQRFPSLSKGNIAYNRGIEIKIDPSDLTLSTPLTGVAVSNTDFDGDTYHIAPVLETKLQRELRVSLDKSRSYMDLVGGKGIHRFLQLTSTVVANISNWRQYRPPSSAAKKAKMLADFGV